jgi:hypothetical protein
MNAGDQGYNIMSDLVNGGPYTTPCLILNGFEIFKGTLRPPALNSHLWRYNYYCPALGMRCGRRNKMFELTSFFFREPILENAFYGKYYFSRMFALNNSNCNGIIEPELVPSCVEGASGKHQIVVDNFKNIRRFHVDRKFSSSRVS